MDNPFKKTDDGRDDGSDNVKKDDYRDDPSLFAESSDYAQRGTTGEYSGGGPGDSSQSLDTTGQGNNGGSQEDWRGKKGSAAPQASDKAVPPGQGTTDSPPDAAYGDVKSRSADPGQSSYGGFKDEGPSSNNAVQQKAADAKRDGPPSGNGT